MKALVEWIKGLFEKPCQHLHLESRFRWEGEWAYCYDECLDCGEELYE